MNAAGFLNIYKPRGITSHDVVGYLRKVTGIKQIGHTGTLDPFAEGVLPVCIGKATRLIEYLKDDKAYCALVRFGKTTDTYDLDGEVSEVFEKKVTEFEIKKALESFRGEILQTPPIYSALKVNGKKLYDYARNGETVEIAPRKVTIEKISLEKFDENLQCAEIFVKCSKGTYIRSIAHDLGKILNCGGYLSALVRTQAGDFTAENSIALYDLKTAEDVEEKLLNPVDVLNLPKIILSEKEHEKVIHGNSIVKKIDKSVDFVILIYNNSVTAIGIAGENEIKVKKVFETK